MGFFGTKKKCAVCGFVDGRYKMLQDDLLCEVCKTKMKITAREIRKSRVDELKEFAEELSKFVPTKKITVYLEVDEVNKKFLCPLFRRKVYNFSDLVGYQLIQNDETVAQGGVGRAFLGGALFGGTGAIVGGVTGKKTKGYCSSLKIRLTVNDINNPMIILNFIGVPTPIKTLQHNIGFKMAQECLSLLQLISYNVKTEEKNNQLSGIIKPKSVADEILKFKILLDQGIITKEEFESKKKQLLGL